ncbi:hypothetical protein LSTR_LSTR007391 [Laodelphax striatellus]|uniref:Uncharacterized protein n=1 Tax=Laodelphax striatellus TaxID=195883 RepID=A0A482XPD2_LAOST|nr:hypothetical protein LSTR_LSTR007391 [Laodelphax striatellus]
MNKNDASEIRRKTLELKPRVICVASNLRARALYREALQVARRLAAFLLNKVGKSFASWFVARAGSARGSSELKLSEFSFR